MGNLTYVRWVRAAVLSLLVVASTLAAHGAGGGALPDLSMLVPVSALVTLGSAALLPHPLSWWWTAALLLAGQTALHGALQLLAAPVATAGVTGHAAGAGAPHPGGEPGVTALRAVTEWSADALMVGAHIAAAVLVGAWLAAGERAVWSVLALASVTTKNAWLRLVRVLRASVVPTLVPARRSAPWGLEPAPSRVDWPVSGVTRRGPPTNGCARFR